MCMNSSSGSVSEHPVASRSICCPPAMPREPAASARIFTISSCVRASSAMRCSASSWKASDCSASPTSSAVRSEEHTSELQSPCNLVCRLLLEKKKDDHPQELERLHRPGPGPE